MKTKTTKQMTLAELEARFSTEDACKSYLASRRWPDGVRCPRCGSDKVYELSRAWAALAMPMFHQRLSFLCPGGNNFRKYQLSLANLVQGNLPYAE